MLSDTKMDIKTEKTNIIFIFVNIQQTMYFFVKIIKHLQKLMRGKLLKCLGLLVFTPN